MKSAIMVLIMLPFVCLFISVLLYLINRSRYNRLISDFQEKYSFPVPYQLHSNMGYLGSPLMSYFFIRLKKNKKIFFLDRNNQAYNFVHENENLKKINELKPLYYVFLFGFLCCILLLLTALIIKIIALENV